MSGSSYNTANARRIREQRQQAILRKLSRLERISMLEIGFNATPDFIRKLAASGLVRVTVEITPRGRAMLSSTEAKDKRKQYREALARHQAEAA